MDQCTPIPKASNVAAHATSWLPEGDTYKGERLLQLHEDRSCTSNEITGAVPPESSDEQLPKRVESNYSQLEKQVGNSKSDVDLCPLTLSSLRYGMDVTERRKGDILLKPLSFPESSSDILSCFLGPELDVPMSCLLCSQTFGSSVQQPPITVEQSQLYIGLNTCGDGSSSNPQSEILSSPPEQTDRNASGKLSNYDEIHSTPQNQNRCDALNTSTSRDSNLGSLSTDQSHKCQGQMPKSPRLKLAPKDEWLRHLVMEHKVVIHNVKDICSLKCYSEYWKKRLAQAPITDFTPVIRTNTDSDKFPSEDYYLLGDILPEDKSLRLQLHRKRLEMILEVQQAERKETSFSRRCLFCSQFLTGNRSALFQHMLDSHGFNVGQPDNLVFVNGFLDLLQEKLDSLQCLFCERTFRDRATLKDHMRKKGHKKINSQNKSYDKFYVINYLEFGKTWEQVQSEDDRDVGYVDESDWSEWYEPLKNPVFCLFCLTPCASIDSVLVHMRETHTFDLTVTCAGMQLDYYGQVKLVNYIRRRVYSDSCVYCSQQCQSLKELLDHMRSCGHFMLPSDRAVWDQPQHLFPTYENDSLLCSLGDELLPSDASTV